jgi:Peptidase propeptide and YPEB domain
VTFDNPNIARRDFLLALLGSFVFASVRPAQADDKGGDGGSDDGGGDDGGDGGDGGSGSNGGQGGNRIRDAVRDGDSRPLKDILATVRKSHQGLVVHVGLIRSAAGLVYKIRMIDENNRLIDIRVDAKSGKILSVKAV